MHKAVKSGRSFLMVKVYVNLKSLIALHIVSSFPTCFLKLTECA